MTFKTHALFATSALVCVVAASPAAAQTRMFDIPAQAASSGIAELGRQGDVQIGVARKIARDKRSNAVRGEMTVRQALERLLQGTGLRAEATGAQTYTIVASPERGAATTSTAALAQSATGEDGGAESAQAEEILVTGSRLKSDGESTAPVTIFSKKKIEQLGASSVSDVLNYLPQRSFSTSDEVSFAGAQAIQLRGLGLGTTLVLINGRRTVTTALQGARAFFDVNNVPLPAVERIEVLADSASAVYGADAVAGVVNIILKDKIERPVADLYYGITPDGGSSETRASLGFGLSSDRFRSGFTLDYFRRTPLYGSARAITASKDFRRYGGNDTRLPYSDPGNVYSTTGAPLPGLTSTFAAVPVGSSGVGLTPADFVATDGTLNLESSTRFASIIPRARRLGAVAFAEYDVSDAVTLFGNFMFADRKEASLVAPPSIQNSLVPATNPFNPFGVPVRVNFMVGGIGLREDQSESQTYHGVVGVKGTKGAWNWDVSGLFIRDNGWSRLTRQLDFTRVNAALASTDPATALNPFQDGPGGSKALLESLIAAPLHEPSSSTARQVSAFASGPLFALPGGNVEVVVGGEARKEGIVFDATSSGIFLDVDRTTYAAFGEVRIPLISAAMGVPLIRSLSAKVAARYDHYNDFGGTFNPQYGLEWNVSRNLMVRASYGTSFRPPSLFELYQPAVFYAGLQQVIDPKRKNEFLVVDLRSGGNVDLKPEDATSFSSGIVFNSQNGLRLSVDYWHIKQDLRVQRFVPSIVVDNEDTFPERVIRAAPTAQDIAAGLPGRIIEVDATSANFGGVKTDGFDIRADYKLDTDVGTFDAGLIATYLDHFSASTLPGQPAIERAGRAGTTSIGGSLPRWKATGNLGWTWKGVQLTTTGRYIDDYADTDSADVLTGQRVHSQFLVDVQLGYTFGAKSGALRGALDGLNIRIGAFNIFDKAPPFSAIGNVGYDYTQSDLRQRFVYVKLSKTF